MIFEIVTFVVVVILIQFLKEYCFTAPRISNIHERHVLITGCGSGFGNKLAKRLEKLGMNVYAGCHSNNSTEKLNQETGSRLKAFTIDITKNESVKKAFDFVSNDLGSKPLWALVNNAGVGSAVVPFDWLKEEDYKKVFDVNLFGHIQVTLKFLPLLKRGGEGRVVNTSSVNGIINVWSTPYGLSKFALEALSDGLSYELKPFNISVHTLQPSMFKTKMADLNLQTWQITQAWERLDSATQKEYGVEFLHKQIFNFTNMQENNANTNLDPVVNAFEDAILSTKPRNRYLLGWEGKFILYPISLLPFSWQFTIMPLVQKLGGLEPPLPASVK